MLVSLSTNIDLILYANSKFKAVYVGNNEIWTRTAISFNNFLKYNYENIGFKFVSPPTGLATSPLDQFYSMSIVNDFIVGPDQTYVYDYDGYIKYDTSNSLTSFVNTITTGLFDQNYDATAVNFVDYKTVIDATAIYDQAYYMDLITSFILGPDQTYVTDYDYVIKYDSSNSLTSFIDAPVFGLFDQYYNAKTDAFVDYKTIVDLTAIYDQAYAVDLINSFILGPDQSYTYDYDAVIKYDNVNSLTSFIDVITTGLFDQNYSIKNVDFVDYATIIDNTAIYNKAYAIDIINNFIAGPDQTYVFDFDDTITHNSTTMATNFIGDPVYTYDQIYVYTVSNMATYFK